MIEVINNNVLNYYLNKYSLHQYLNINLIKSCKIYTFKKNEAICTLNERLEYIYFLVKGKTKVTTLLSSGQSLLLCFNNPLSIIGDLELLDNPYADCNVVTLEECICIAIPIWAIHMFGYDDPTFLRFIISSLEIKLRNNSIYSSINILYPLENRFASYLLSILPSNSDKLIIEGVNHISELLGSSYRHLNRVIKTLADSNIIRKNRNEIHILDISKLEALAKDIYR